VAVSGNKTLHPFSDVVERLKRLCFEKRSGTMYMITGTGHAATITLSKGKIIEVFHLMKGGMEAVKLLTGVEIEYFFFNNDLTVRENPKIYNDLLPSNESVFEVFSNSVSSTGENVNVKQKKILVVEDSGMARKVVVDTLVKENYFVYEAVDGEQAVELISSIRPNLVLLDLILPKLDGYEVLDIIRKNDEYKRIPVIALTSRDALFDKLKGRMRGTDEYLTKPVKTDELLEKVAEHLARQDAGL